MRPALLEPQRLAHCVHNRNIIITKHLSICCVHTPRSTLSHEVLHSWSHLPYFLFFFISLLLQCLSFTMCLLLRIFLSICKSTHSWVWNILLTGRNITMKSFSNLFGVTTTKYLRLARLTNYSASAPPWLIISYNFRSVLITWILLSSEVKICGRNL